MSRSQDVDRQRPRSNTTSFAPFAGWRRGKPEPAPLPGPLPVDALIDSLTPPAVPSPTNARALAAALAALSPLPRPAVLNPALASLCAVDSPPALQAAGYDIMSAYWENSEAPALTTSDRLAYFSLFLELTTPWSEDLWESRFRALRALTKMGVAVIGVEVQVLDVLKSWIEAAFDALLSPDTIEHGERVERERSIDILSAFLSTVLDRPETVARIPPEQLIAVLHFYADLLQRSLDVPDIDAPAPTSPEPPTPSSATPSRSFSHRRHPSSLSIPSVPPPARPPPAAPPKHPAAVAVALYLQHLASQLRSLSPVHLSSILPLLFRSLAFYASPLPRLTITTVFPTTSSPEDRITETLNALFTGPYATSSMLVLKHHLFPPSPSSPTPLPVAIQVSIGAHRTLRNYVRRGLCTRLARAYIARESSVSYAPSGAPGHLDLERDLMERAWPKEDVSGWDPAKLTLVLARAVEAWVDCNFGLDLDAEIGALIRAREGILDEAAGTVKDVLQEMDAREDGLAMDDDEAGAVGEALYALASYLHPLKNPDGTPFVVPLAQPTDAPTPFLRTLSSLLAREHTLPLIPLLSTTLLSIADHLTDADAAKLPLVMLDQHDLSPTSAAWLANWAHILANRALLRPAACSAAMCALAAVYGAVRDMPAYRRPLADLVADFCGRVQDGAGEVAWGVLSDEVVLRADEAAAAGQAIAHEDAESDISAFLDLLITTAIEGDPEPDEDDTASIATADTSPPPYVPSTTVSPTLSRMQSDFQSVAGSKESALPSVMSLLSSFTTGGNASRSQSQHTLAADEHSPARSQPPPPASDPRAVCAVSALVGVFAALAFAPSARPDAHAPLAKHIFRVLVRVVGEARAVRARLAALQFLMRLRADRDHRLYYVQGAYDPDGHAATLGGLVHRDAEGGKTEAGEAEEAEARPRKMQERDGRRVSRGRGKQTSGSMPSRSRSRAAPSLLPLSAPPLKPRETLWGLPEVLPFALPAVDTPSEGLISYHPVDAECPAVLPVSVYLTALVHVLESEKDKEKAKEKNWEILSYVLCHLPVQLANKHLFCGPKSRGAMVKLLTTLCSGILSGELASDVDRWPNGLKARDAHGLAYHTLSVLISYRRCFDIKLRHLLVEVFQKGLNGQPSTVKCCLHALSLAAFELPSSITKCLSRILEKLSQIMSNPDMAVHIISFLSIVGSLRELHANFTESDFKMVFGVALQYLQHHNRSRASPTISWALSQHVRIMAYYLVYIWFLAVKLPDRPRHVQFITRQLLLANDGSDEVDEPTEVCFDWLARYTYASADPRPAKSMLDDVVMNPSAQRASSPEIALREKTWIMGNSVVTIRTLARLGWIEVMSRRPSGVTKFLCRLENVPMVGPGDVDPNMVSVPATLLMDREPSVPENPPSSDSDPALQESETPVQAAYRGVFASENETDETLQPPDPITGYVWSGTAPCR